MFFSTAGRQAHAREHGKQATTAIPRSSRRASRKHAGVSFHGEDGTGLRTWFAKEDVDLARKDAVAIVSVTAGSRHLYVALL